MISIRGLRPSYHGDSDYSPEPVTYRPRVHSRQAAWSASEIETVRSMWSAGKSAGQIGERLGRSRNAILGKVRRMGLHRKDEV